LEYVNMDDSGTATGQFKNFYAPGTSNTTLSMKQYDIIPYYNILDNTAWITLDIGVDFKVTDIVYEAKNVEVVPGSSLLTTYSDSDRVIIPLLYLRTRLELLGTDIGLEADGKFISYDDSNIYDIRVKVDYTLDFIPIIQPAIEVGYRTQKIDLANESAGDAEVNLEYSGVYAGIFFRY